MMILSFDTSNYTTSACLFESEKGIVWQNRILLHPGKNQCGLRQSDVVFLHTKNMECLLKEFPKVEIDAVVASARPRPINNSYMPCFLVGKNYGKMLSDILSCPFETYSHQENHILAAMYSADQMQLMNKEFIAFHISGGTSDILYIKPTKCGLDISQIGGSADLHAGQLIDRIGVMLGLEFPCGKAMEPLAEHATVNIPIKTSVRGYNFHLSGFENQAQKLISNNTPAENIARFAINAVLESIDKVITNIRNEYPNIPILLAGGVMSNQMISKSLNCRHENLYFSHPFYSSDHALGNAVLYDYLH